MLQQILKPPTRGFRTRACRRELASAKAGGRPARKKADETEATPVARGPAASLGCEDPRQVLRAKGCRGASKFTLAVDHVPVLVMESARPHRESKQVHTPTQHRVAKNAARGIAGTVSTRGECTGRGGCGWTYPTGNDVARSKGTQRDSGSPGWSHWGREGAAQACGSGPEGGHRVNDAGSALGKKDVKGQRGLAWTWTRMTCKRRGGCALEKEAPTKQADAVRAVESSILIEEQEKKE
ncbi:hypothetical protein C8R44DRAFT_747750 [Mycena epipterygia]|nr:hypothetical protein C8R44DRAFT_747750 [Mycena epipterygia]